MLPEHDFRKSPLAKLIRQMEQIIDQSFQRHPVMIEHDFKYQETDDAHHFYFTFSPQVQKEQINVKVYPTYIRIMVKYEEQEQIHNEKQNQFNFSESRQHIERNIPLPLYTNHTQIKTDIMANKLHIMIPKAI